MIDPEILKKFDENFIEEIKGASIRQKILIIHLAIEYLLYEILKLKIENPKILEYILEDSPKFYDIFRLIKRLDLFDPDEMYNKLIDKEKIKKIKISLRDKGNFILENINAEKSGKPLTIKKPYEFGAFWIANKEALKNNIKLINQLRNKFAHNFFINEREIEKIVHNLQIIYNSDIWLMDYKDKLEIIGSNTVFLLKELVFYYNGNLEILYDDKYGPQRQISGTKYFTIIFHIKLPSFLIQENKKD